MVLRTLLSWRWKSRRFYFFAHLENPSIVNCVPILVAYSSGLIIIDGCIYYVLSTSKELHLTIQTLLVRYTSLFVKFARLLSLNCLQKTGHQRNVVYARKNSLRGQVSVFIVMLVYARAIFMSLGRISDLIFNFLSAQREGLLAEPAYEEVSHQKLKWFVGYHGGFK